MRRWPLYLFIISFGLRLINLGDSLFWYDESFTAFMTRLDFPATLAAVRADTHPPLWYAIEWATRHLIGDSEFALRLPAALFGSAAVAAAFFLVRHLKGDEPARWASGLLAVMPGQLYYSQEARMYSLLTLLVILATYGILTRRWLITGVAMVLIVYTQNLGGLYSLILGVWSLIASRGRSLKYLAIPAIGYLPQAVVALEQFRAVGQRFWIADPGNIGGALYYLGYTTVFVRLPEALQLHGFIAAMGFTVASLIVLRHDIRRLLPIIALAFLPALLLFAASKIYKPVMLDRALLPSGAFVAMLWGLAIDKLAPRFRLPLAAVGLPVLLVAVVFYYIDPNGHRPKDNQMTDIIEEQWRPGDAIYHVQLDSLIGSDYYLAGKPAYLLPQKGDLAQSLSDPTRAAMGITDRQVWPQQLKAEGYKRLWVPALTSIVTSQFELDFQADLINAYPVLAHWTIAVQKLETLDLYLLRL